MAHANLFKRVWRRITRPLTHLIATDRLRECEGGGLICPVYHTCRDKTPTWWGTRYRVKPLRELKADLEYLAKIGPFLAFDDLIDFQEGRRTRPRGCFLSFDDGYRELYEQIAPLLKKLGIPATFFVISSLVDNTAAFHEDLAGEIAFRLRSASPNTTRFAQDLCLSHGVHLETALQQRTPNWKLLYGLCQITEIDVRHWLDTERPYLTQDHLRELANSGFEIAAHSIDHPLFSEIDDKQKIEQIKASCVSISQACGKPCRAFAFPYGEFGLTKSSWQHLISADLVPMYFGTRGITSDELEPRVIQRVLAEDHKGSFQSYLHEELRIQFCRVQSGRGVVVRQG